MRYDLYTKTSQLSHNSPTWQAYFIIFFVFWFLRLEENTRERENQNFPQQSHCPVPLSLKFLSVQIPSPADPLQLRQILSTNLSLQRPLPQIPSSLKFLSVYSVVSQISLRADPVAGRSSPQISLSSARSPRFRRPAFPLRQIQLSLSPAPAPPDSPFSLGVRRPPFSSPFSLGVRRPLSSGRSHPSPALSPADLLSGGQVFFFFFFFFFLFCCYILFEILIWGFFVLFLFWLLRELWFCSFVVLLCILLYYNFWVVFPLHTRCLIKCSTEHVVDFRGFGLIYWLRTRNYE